jgi:hypothetical protein
MENFPILEVVLRPMLGTPITRAAAQRLLIGSNLRRKAHNGGLTRAQFLTGCSSGRSREPHHRHKDDSGRMPALLSGRRERDSAFIFGCTASAQL